jgi:hypothetical protein
MAGDPTFNTGAFGDTSYPNHMQTIGLYAVLVNRASVLSPPGLVELGIFYPERRSGFPYAFHMIQSKYNQFSAGLKETMSWILTCIFYPRCGYMRRMSPSLGLSAAECGSIGE